jgi:hypothetical protein
MAFFSNDFFSSDWSATGRVRRGLQFPGACPEHEDNPKPIKGRQCGMHLEVLQYRPAFALQVRKYHSTWTSDCLAALL